MAKWPAVNQVFSGPISGNAILLLDREAAMLLNRLLTDRSDTPELDGAAREVITEVGNIVLNACLGAFGNLLKVQVTFTVPSLQIESVQKVLRSITVGGERAGIRLDHSYPFSHAGQQRQRLPGHHSGRNLTGNVAVGIKEMGRAGTPVSNTQVAERLAEFRLPKGWTPAFLDQQFAPYGVVTLDESFRVQSWNHWMELHSGMPFADVAGKSLFALFPDLKERKLVSRFERALRG